MDQISGSTPPLLLSPLLRVLASLRESSSSGALQEENLSPRRKDRQGGPGSDRTTETQRTPRRAVLRPDGPTAFGGARDGPEGLSLFPSPGGPAGRQQREAPVAPPGLHRPEGPFPVAHATGQTLPGPSGLTWALSLGEPSAGSQSSTPATPVARRARPMRARGEALGRGPG